MGKKTRTLQDKNEPQGGAEPCTVVQAFGPQGGRNDGCFFLFTNTSWTSSSESRRGRSWGGACPSARVDRSGWVGLREGVRDEGEEPQAPSLPPPNQLKKL